MNLTMRSCFEESFFFGCISTPLKREFYIQDNKRADSCQQQDAPEAPLRVWGLLRSGCLEGVQFGHQAGLPAGGIVPVDDALGGRFVQGSYCLDNQ
jgi:hypothetical protein